MLECVHYFFVTYHGINDTILEFLIVFYEHLIHKVETYFIFQKINVARFSNIKYWYLNIFIQK